ncbi:MAG: type II 3-dehydroquinate dehydratase [Pseudomonadota bacterium]
MGRVYILNGPNLNMLGVREPEIYGRETLADLEARCRERATALSLEVEFRQSNHEGALVDWIQEAEAARRDGAEIAVILNAGGYTHTSIALLDALRAFGGPVIELHLSNPHRREGFRKRSFVAEAADGVIAGFGGLGYPLAVDAAARLLAKRNTDHRQGA